MCTCTLHFILGLTKIIYLTISDDKKDGAISSRQNPGFPGNFKRGSIKCEAFSRHQSTSHSFSRIMHVYRKECIDKEKIKRQSFINLLRLAKISSQ